MLEFAPDSLYLVREEFASQGSRTFSPENDKCQCGVIPDVNACGGLPRPIRHRALVAGGLLFAALVAAAEPPAHPALELSRPVRTWEFLPIVGTRAGLFGNESGDMEAWVYPLKLFRDFHLTFRVEGRAVPAESLVRTLIVHPESSTLVYAGDNFSVRETLFVPVREPGAFIYFDVETEQPLEIEASFIGDFQLEWPAALGGTFIEWNDLQHAFVLGEELKKNFALVGSPSASEHSLAYQTNFSASDRNSLRLGVTEKGRESKVVVIAASMQGLDDAESTYQRLTTSYGDLLRESAKYYSDYLEHTVKLTLPDVQLQQAYDWSRISVIQGLATNPLLGTGLVAGYRTSGTSQRPGFAWFFGRDSFWTSFALNSAGDFATARAALEFIGKFQREDGKIPHEISQGASFVPWFKDFPYAYASADATPLYIIAANDYVVRSGDVEFVRQKWDSLWKAYEFLQSTYDAQNSPQNLSFGHGWVEAGPLLPVKTEFYQSGLGLEALRSLANLAALAGKADTAKELQSAFDRQKPEFNRIFWSPEKKAFAFALDEQSRQVEELSVLTTVPMWFGLTEEDKAKATIQQLAAADVQTDWGMRIISNRSPLYNGSGYHFGSVWPLFTGWASVAEYRYHQPFPAYENLRANALLAMDGSLGHVAEVLSGDYYQPLSTNSPHQIWSAAMVVNPLLRGLLGIGSDALSHTLNFAPHVPADWRSFTVDNLRVGQAVVSVGYQKLPGAIDFQFKRTGAENCVVALSPALSLRSTVTSVDLNGHALPFHVSGTASDQHVNVRVALGDGTSTIRIHLKNDFGVGFSSLLPALGSSSQGLRVISESWDSAHSQVSFALSGLTGKRYDLSIWNPSQIASVRGGTLKDPSDGPARITVEFPAAPEASYIRRDVVISFVRAK